MKSLLCRFLAGSSLALISIPVVAASPCGAGAGSITNLPGLGGAVVQFSALGQGGELTGFSYLPSNMEAHAFLYRNGTVTDVGTLGGNVSQGFAVNRAGQVAGESSLLGEGQTHAFLWSGGSMRDLGTLGGSYSTVAAINEAGQVAGTSLVEFDMDFEAFLYSGGTMVGLGSLGGGGSVAAALNENGWVVGESYTSAFETHGFLHRDGAIDDLGTLGGGYSSAVAINGAGAVVGESSLADGNTHAFAWTGGTMQDLGTLGGDFSSTLAINASGQILGVSELVPYGPQRGFIHANGQMTDLGTLGGQVTWPQAINNQGQIVGYSELANYARHAFLWENGAMVDLNTRLPADSGWELTSADFINDAGMVVGAGNYQGVRRYYLLTLGGAANTNPVAVVDVPATVQCGPLTLDGSRSSDPDGGDLHYEWTLGGKVIGIGAILSLTLPPGSNTITLKVTDRCGATAETEAGVLVADTVPPVVVAPPGRVIATTSQCQGVVPDLRGELVAFDNCTEAGGLVTVQVPSPGSLLGVGSHVVIFAVQDIAGNIGLAATTVTVADVKPPAVIALAASPSQLWPPNHQMVPVSLAVQAADDCDGLPRARILSVSCSEAMNPGDYAITGDLTLNLAAAKATNGGERVYQLTVECRDAGGNSVLTRVNVTVPKNSPEGGGVITGLRSKR